MSHRYETRSTRNQSYILRQLLTSACGHHSTGTTTLNHIGKIGDASCEMETQFDNNSQVEKASLTFYSLDELPTDEHLAFVITTVQGEAYIIGTKELPYPIIKVTRSTGIPDGEPFVRKYEISFTAKKIPQIQV